MSESKKRFISNALNYFEGLERRGSPRVDTSGSLFLLRFIEEILSAGCYYSNLDDRALGILEISRGLLSMHDPFLRPVPGDSGSYKNLDTGRNIDDYKRVDYNEIT